MYIGFLLAILELDGGLGEKYLIIFITEGNINELNKYEMLVRNKQPESIKFYDFEAVYLFVLVKILIKIRKDKPTILKAINDTV